YVDLKVQTARKIGITADAVRFSAGTSTATIVDTIRQFNQDGSVHGIMVQSPIPGLDLQTSLEIFNAIAETKDVDGLSFASLGKLWQLKSLEEWLESDFFVSATPLAVIDCLSWL